MNVVWDALVPQHHKVVAGLPSLEALVGQASFFGYMESLHHRNYEPRSLGSMRVCFEGDLRFVTAPVSALLAFVPQALREECIKGNSTAQEAALDLMISALGDATQETAKEMATKCQVCSFSVIASTDKPVAITIPACCIFICPPINHKKVSGVRRSFAGKSKKTMENLAAATKLGGHTILQSLTELLSVGHFMMRKPHAHSQARHSHSQAVCRDEFAAPASCGIALLQ